MIRESPQGYVIIKSLLHYGCIATPTGKCADGKAEFFPIYCPHSSERIWLERGDI